MLRPSSGKRSASNPRPPSSVSHQGPVDRSLGPLDTTLCPVSCPFPHRSLSPVSSGVPLPLRPVSGLPTLTRSVHTRILSHEVRFPCRLRFRDPVLTRTPAFFVVIPIYHPLLQLHHHLTPPFPVHQTPTRPAKPSVLGGRRGMQSQISFLSVRFLAEEVVGRPNVHELSVVTDHRRSGPDLVK